MGARHTAECQLWAVWALANLTTVSLFLFHFYFLCPFFTFTCKSNHRQSPSFFTFTCKPNHLNVFTFPFFTSTFCLDNQVKVFLRLPREATSRRLLPREPNHTYVSRGIQTIQSFLKLNHATSYISRDSRIRPSVSRGIKTIPSQRLPRNQNHTISTSPEGTKPYHLNVSRGIKTMGQFMNEV